MSAKGYTTDAKIAEFLGKTISDSLTNYILYAEQVIDSITGRNFKADTAASAKLFNGKGDQQLKIDDCVEITKVEVGDNAYGDSFSTLPVMDPEGGVIDGYIKLPNNYEKDEVPIYGLLLRNRFWVLGIQNCRITAKWGYSVAVPDDIVLAATVIAGGMYNANHGGGTGSVKSERIGNYSVSYDVGGAAGGWAAFDRAKQILENYKKYNI